VAQRQHSKIEDIDVIAPNFKRRLSGVTSTIIQLVPLQAAMGLKIATLGPGLPEHLPYIRFRDLWRLWKRPHGKPVRVWHARRNVEMIAGLVLRDLLRMPLKLVFTSAAQREHKTFTKFLIARMNHVVATGSKSAAFLQVPHTVIMHGVDADSFVPSAKTKAETRESLGLVSGQKLAGCFGRVRYQKGTDLFVDAMIELLPRHPDWVAIICGRVTAEHAQFGADLEGRIAAAGLTERLMFLGEVPDILPYYQAIDLYIAPSRNEGFGLTPLEAMACGVPVVTSDAGAYADLVQPGKNGEICPAGDGQMLIAAIESLFANPAKTKAMGAYAQDFVRANFALQREATSINGIYFGLLSEVSLS
jgi:mannosyltransferase